MKELLNTQEKQLIKDHFRSHILYRLINQSCKKYEVVMQHLKYSPEEMFLSIVLRLEELRDDPDNSFSTIRRLWDELFCRYREREGDIPDEEVVVAVQTVLCFLYICLNSQDDSQYVQWGAELATVLAQHANTNVQAVLDAMLSDIYQVDNGEEELSEWINDYLGDISSLSEDIAAILATPSEDSLLDTKDNAFPLSVTQCIILYSYLLDEGIACLDTNDSKLAEFIGSVTPYKPSSIRTAIHRINVKKTYKGQIVQDAQLVAKIVKQIKPEVAQDILDTFAP